MSSTLLCTICSCIHTIVRMYPHSCAPFVMYSTLCTICSCIHTVVHHFLMYSTLWTICSWIHTIVHYLFMHPHSCALFNKFYTICSWTPHSCTPFVHKSSLLFTICSCSNAHFCSCIHIVMQHTKDNYNGWISDATKMSKGCSIFYCQIC